MTNHQYVARSKAIAARPIGDETMVMSARSSTLFTLDEVASVIWAAVDGVTPLHEIVTREVCSRFEVSPDIALRDAEALVAQLAEHGILLVSDQPLNALSAAREERP
ncbi:MAG TPA: PqqD family protein [Candidatus Acidoferrales bacterium]|nr:PqqD family protein [Candidatus Acidoferrales bacterium]